MVNNIVFFFGRQTVIDVRLGTHGVLRPGMEATTTSILQSCVFKSDCSYGYLHSSFDLTCQLVNCMLRWVYTLTAQISTD